MWSLMDQVWNWNINNKYNPVNLIYKILRDNHENAPNTISLKTSVCDKEESLSSVLEKRAENGCSSTVSTGYRHPSPREALTPTQQHSLHTSPTAHYVHPMQTASPFFVNRETAMLSCGDLSPTLGEDVCALLCCKTSVLLYLLILGSATKSWWMLWPSPWCSPSWTWRPCPPPRCLNVSEFNSHSISLESFWTVWKVSEQSGKFLDSLESFQTV